MRALLVAVAVAACGPRAREPAVVTATPGEGIAIAIYASADRSYAVVDDRRRVTLRGGQVLLDRIDHAAPLQSLVLEALDGRDEIQLTACARERVDESAAALQSLLQARGERPKRLLVVRGLHDDRFEYVETGQMEAPILPGAHVLSPIVQCTVNARAADRLVRVMHVTSAIGFRTLHELSMTQPGRAQLTTRFSIQTPAWGARADVTLWEGLPGDETPPRELVRSTIVLDGSTAILAQEGGTVHDVPARLRSIYAGAKLDDTEDIKPNDIAWARDSQHHVWVWLELGAPLANGTIRAHVELPGSPARDVEIEPALREHTRDRSMTRVPLWIDEDLLGTRKRTIDRADGVIITDRLQLTIANRGTHAREVWLEERLRPTARRRTLSQSWPARPQLVNDIARVKLTLAPGQTERVGFTIDYDF